MSEEHSAELDYVERVVLFTDIEGSTAQWEQSPARMAERLREHDALLAACVELSGGTLLKHTGDGLIATFTGARSAVGCAVAMQRSLAEVDRDPPLLVRIGIHAGPVQRRSEDLFGPVLNRAARIMGVAHGGQILVSQLVRMAADDDEGFEFVDLGLHRLKGLSSPEQVHQVVAVGIGEDFPPPRSMIATLGNLPVFPDDMVNRVSELEQLADELRLRSVTTLVGPGGVGKTRLALHASRLVGATSFWDGAWFVDLAPLGEPGLVAAAVAAAIGVTRRSGQELSDTLRDALGSRDALLVLDNCEWVRDEVRDLLAAVLVTGGGTRVLCTSQVPLGLASEVVIRVEPLATATSAATVSLAELREVPSVALFAERAALVQPGFLLDDTNRSAVVEICEHLDGLPLAIELAAARCQVLAPDAIAERLDQRFALLRGQQGDARHRTLLATLEWSYELLTDAERDLFAVLGAFQASVGVEAVAHVAGIDEFDALDLLSSLVNRSLLTTVVTPHGMRYRLLETMRQYAVLRLAERADGDAVARRYTDWFVLFAADAAVGLLSDAAPEWLDRVAGAYDDLRVVIVELLDADPQRAAQVLNDLSDFWSTREVYPDANRWFAEASRRVGDHQQAVALDSHRSSMEWNLGNAGAAEEAALDAVARAERLDLEPPPLALTRLMVIRCLQGRTGEAAALAADVRAAADRDDDVAHYVLGAVGVVLMLLGDQAQGCAICEAGVVVSRRYGPIRAATALMNLQVALGTSDPSRSLSLATEAGELARRIGSSTVEAHAHMALADVHRSERDTIATLQEVALALSLLRDCGRRSWVVTTTELAIRELSGEAPLVAAMVLGTTARLRSEIGEPGTEAQQAWRARKLEELRGRLGADAGQQAYDDGALLTLDEMVDLFVDTVHDVSRPAPAR